MRLILAVLLTFCFSVFSVSAIACSPPDADTRLVVVASPMPGLHVPTGAAQLKVSAQEEIGEFDSRSRFKVHEVIDGTFEGDTVLVDISNRYGCHATFSALRLHASRNAFFVTVLPLMLPDGSPILDDDGGQVYGALYYESFLPFILNDEELSEFARYADNGLIVFIDLGKQDCIARGDGSDEAWRKCVQPGEHLYLWCRDEKTGALTCEDSRTNDGRPDDLISVYSRPKERMVWASVVALFGLLALGFAYWLSTRRLTGHD